MRPWSGHPNRIRQNTGQTRSLNRLVSVRRDLRTGLGSVVALDELLELGALQMAVPDGDHGPRASAHQAGRGEGVVYVAGASVFSSFGTFGWPLHDSRAMPPHRSDGYGLGRQVIGEP